MDEISAGAVLYTLVDDKIRYLVSLDFHNNWGFPKGHLEKGECEEEAALREIKEEVGIEAQLNIEFREELIYPMANGNIKHSIYFIGCYDDQTPDRQLEEVQETRLLSYEEALDCLTFDNMKEVLKKANSYITEQGIR